MTSRWKQYRQAVGPDLHLVVAPSLFFNTNGMQCAPDSDIWVTSTLGAEVVAFSIHQTTPRRVAVMTDGFSGPDDVAFDRKGNAYFTEPHHARVMCRTANGEISVWAEHLPSANGITMSGDGRLFVDECRPEGRLVEIDLAQPGVFRVVRRDLGMPNALSMGPDGRLYLPEVSLDRVSAVDPASGELVVIAEGIFRPSSVKFHPDGRLVVTSAGSGEVLAIDLATGARSVLVDAQIGLDNTAFGRDGTLYVSNFVNSQLIAVLASGERRELTPPALVQPMSVEPNGRGGYLVANRTSVVDTIDGPIMRMPADFAFIVTHAHRWGAELYLRSADGRLHCDGRVVSQDVTALNSSPMGLLVARGGMVQRAHETIRTGLRRVDAVAGDAQAASGAIAACDRRAGAVFTGDRLLRGFDEPAAVGLSGDIAYVAEVGSRSIVRVDAVSGERRTIATDVPIGSPVPEAPVALGHPGLCVDGDSLVIACNGDASIRRIALAGC